jgi:parallel beta-helix repeat protein
VRFPHGKAAACAGVIALSLMLAQIPDQDRLWRTGALTIHCDHTIGPASSGSSSNGEDGSIERLLRSLRAGQTGCLRGGVYRGEVKVTSSHVKLRSYPGETATIDGRLWVTRGARDVLIADLHLDGRNGAELPSPTVNGTDIRFAGVNATNDHSGICFDIGSSRYGRAREVTIEHSRVHDCGRLPANNTEHGIYVASASDTRIVSNLIYHNADRGIQLYPNAQHTVIEHNVIDGNGEGIIFSGAEGQASSDNLVRHNAITGSRLRANVESWYPAGNPVGVGNLVRENCLYGGHGANGQASSGFQASSNLIADPRYSAPLRGDYQIAASNPCAKLLAG